MQNNKYQQFIQLLIKELPIKKENYLRVKNRISKETGVATPTNANLREVYEKMVAQNHIERNRELEKLLKSRLIRTQSGVAVIAVLTKPSDCPGKCIYCPTEKEMPKSYLSNEPAVMRAISSQFDPYKQVQNRLRSLLINGHETDKIELIVMGGTFSYFDKKYQEEFISECFRACNEFGDQEKSPKDKIRNLAYQQEKNETANHRIIGLTLETRPDYLDEKEILNFRKLGCTRVEIGIQSIFDDVLKITKRGHDAQTSINAIKLLKDAGFKINFHIMPGLPGSDFNRDIEMFHQLFNNSNWQPDMIKIYPTTVTKGTELHQLWKSGKYEALNDEVFEKMVLKIKNEIIPPYVRIARVVRDIPTPSIIAGPKISNLRQLIEKESKCQCIRCREVKLDYTKDDKIILDRINYDASDGKEIFLQFVSPDKKILYALLRLRIPKDNNKDHYIKALQNAALIREIHTYGKLAEISKADEASPQHIGLGKKLLAKAERIAKEEFNLEKTAVISGVGVRNYYRKFGYELEDAYLTKNLK